MRKSLVFALMMVTLVLAGCASYRDVYTSGWKVRAYDNNMYMKRSLHRHRFVEPIKPDQEAAVLVEDPPAEIFNENGYKDGLACVFVNDSRYELRLVINDPHQQQFILRVPSAQREYDRAARTDTTIPGWKELKLESGLHRVRAFRDGRDTPYATGEFSVKSDKNYHVEVGQRNYFGGGRFGD